MARPSNTIKIMRAVREAAWDDSWRLECKCHMQRNAFSGEIYLKVPFKPQRTLYGELYIECLSCYTRHPVPDEILRKAGIEESSKLEAESKTCMNILE